MESKEKSRAQISALMDGEIADAELDLLLAELAKEESGKDWEIYHRIGDVLRADHSKAELSADFSPRLKARLDLEPAHGGTASDVTANQPTVEEGVGKQMEQQSGTHRWVVPGVLAVAATAIGVMGAPQLTMAIKGESATTGSSAKVASGRDLSLPITASDKTNTLGVIKASGPVLAVASGETRIGAQVAAAAQSIQK